MKVAAIGDKTHNPSGETRWVSRLRENLTSGSYGEGLETGRSLCPVPRQSFTRQILFRRINDENTIQTLHRIYIGIFAIHFIRQRWRYC